MPAPPSIRGGQVRRSLLNCAPVDPSRSFVLLFQRAASQRRLLDHCFVLGFVVVLVVAAAYDRLRMPVLGFLGLLPNPAAQTAAAATSDSSDSAGRPRPLLLSAEAATGDHRAEPSGAFAEG